MPETPRGSVASHLFEGINSAQSGEREQDEWLRKMGIILGHRALSCQESKEDCEMGGATRNAGLLSEVRTLFGCGVTAHVSDCQLLDQFLTGGHAEAEAAFTLLIERHGS